METKNKYWLFLTIFCLGMGLTYERAYADLDPKYLRNGETYLLIGSGSKKGVYRLNNPTDSSDPYVYGNKKGDAVISNLGDTRTIAIAVDIWRDLYTFTNTGSDGMASRDYIWRQVLNSDVPELTTKGGVRKNKNQTADYGKWDRPHTDSRPYNLRKNIYRTVTDSSDTRTILGSIRALKPGTNNSFVENPPSWYKLPACQEFINKDLDLGVYNGRTWYKIPNKSWYSSWKPNALAHSGTHSDYVRDGEAYMCFYDDENADTNIYNKWIWRNKNKNNTSIDYSEYDSTHGDGGEVARTESINITRYVCAGCLDSCTQKTAPGSYESATMTCDIAMQPGLLKDGSETECNPDRTYALTRSVGATDCTLTKSEGTTTANYTETVKGYKSNSDSQWIGLSLKSATKDFVYVLGNSGLKHLYESNVKNGNASGFEFTAVTVSNQWNEKGGIIYAYEKNTNNVYRFTCDDAKNPNEQAITLAETDPWDKIDVKGVIGGLGGDVSNPCLDDIKSDGFGSLYMGVSFPSVNAGFDANKAVRPKESKWKPKHFHAGEHSDETGTNIEVVYPVDYGKYIFTKPYNSTVISEVGHKALGTVYYSFIANVATSSALHPTGGNDTACVAELNANASKPDVFFAVLKKYNATVNGYSLDNAPWGTEDTPISKCIGSGLICNCYEYHRPMGNVENPTNCKLAVINVPTPPKVESILGTKKSYLDICGPYTEIPDDDNASTNQGAYRSTTSSMDDNGIVTLNPLEDNFFMVENYPLPSGAQNPNDFRDYDSDTRFGGFVSTIENVKDNIYYEWKVWCVHNGNKAVCKLKKEYPTTSSRYGMGRPFVPFSYDSGKYIIACRVKYNWYDYDKLKFGSTIRHKEDQTTGCRQLNTYALPSDNGFPAAAENGLFGEKATSRRLAEIKSTPEFAFMNNAVDSSGNPIDYSQIVGSGANNEKWALLPIVVSGSAPAKEELTEIASIERCDSNPSVASNWASAPTYVYSDLTRYNGVFGVESEKSYYWRIAIASQSNLCFDIEHNNGTVQGRNDYNYIADRTLNPYNHTDSNGNQVANPLYIDPGVPDANGRYRVFSNNLGDLQWDDNEIEMKACLYRQLPGEAGIQTIPIKDIESYAVGNNLYIRTKKDLPVTDPGSATIEITMSRWFNTDLQRLDADGLPTPSTTPKLRKYNIIGRAQINVIDTKKPSICYSDTKPNNLYGYTGESIVNGLNPADIQFSIKDNNPWEGDSTSKGISLDRHVRNYIYNFGMDKAAAYCKLTPALQEAWDNITSSDKTNLVSAATENKNKKRFNLLPMFSREASDVRLYFETVKRVVSNDGKQVHIDKGRADTMYDAAAFPFAADSNIYASHYRGGNDSTSLMLDGDPILTTDIRDDDSPAATNDGELKYYTSKTKYKIAVSAIKLGVHMDKTGPKTRVTCEDRIPDYYANNSVNYSPYKFYVSAIDCSGNYFGDNITNENVKSNIDDSNSEIKSSIARELNLRLNVADNIPPVAYGSLYEAKYGKTSYFPYKTKACQNDYENLDMTCGYEYTDNEGFAPNISNGQNGILKKKGNETAAYWLPDGSVNGYINSDPSYQALRPLASNANLGTANNVGVLIKGRDGNKKTIVDLYPDFQKQVQARLSPQIVEDNVECQLGVAVCDNCATKSVASITIAALGPDLKESVPYSIGASTTAILNDEQPGLASNSTRIIFRGLLDDFPMAVPVLIRAEDDAKKMSHYNVNSTEDGFAWDDAHEIGGELSPNVRYFRTVIPVVGSNLDIRTLDKSIKKEKADFGGR